MSSSLQQLAQCLGIYTAYWGLDGHEHVASDETLGRLLQAMGLKPEEIQNPQTTIEAWEVQQWRQCLQPVQIVQQERIQENGLVLELSVAKDHLSHPFHWELLPEAGKGLAGSLGPLEGQSGEERLIADKPYVRLQVTLPELRTLSLGYHQLKLSDLETKETYYQRLIVTPSACYTPESLQGDKQTWGPAVQLYSLKSQRENDWGIGNFSMLDQVCQWSAAEGAGLVALNPLGVLNLVYPEGASPYSPISRLFINPLYIDVTAVPEFHRWAEAHTSAWELYQEQLASLQQAEIVSYSAVAQLKLAVLSELFRDFIQRAAETGNDAAFREFQEEQGLRLKQFGLFQALQERFQGQGWFQWPEVYQQLSSIDWEAVLSQLEVLFPEPPERNQLLHRVAFYEYLQWLGSLQLQAIQENSSLPIGLYLDLTVGADRGGFDVWQHRALYSMDATVGAPPDPLGPKGQNWGLPPLIPHRLREAGYEPFIEVFRQVMRHAGALRIDHVLGLYRLFWIPTGESPDRGTYVAYNMEEMLGIIALESVRNKCLVVGEDLGTVPPEVPGKLKAWNLYSYKVARWERNWEAFQQPYQDPEAYEALAVSSFSTHDTSTLLGLFTGWFFQRLVRLGVLSQEEADTKIHADDQGNQLLLETLKTQGFLEPHISLQAIQTKSKPEVDALILACHQFLAKTRSKVAIVQMEDLLGVEAQVNIPGTNDGPELIPAQLSQGIPVDVNWRRRLPITIEELFQDSTVLKVTKELRAARGIPTLTHSF